ncbi:hypothetical protein NDU88_001852 [Pleurodeles waltl]|uniref:Uncharacterized protein n=1 Tax=Pleurodeles waltl TaxID=8319 RepID=A0AAV7Q7A4_PLEWA|nr:hypothetical protein NDU88_001852 [Pleurodeles waltl]
MGRPSEAEGSKAYFYSWRVAPALVYLPHDSGVGYACAPVRVLCVCWVHVSSIRAQFVSLRPCSQFTPHAPTLNCPERAQRVFIHCRDCVQYSGRNRYSWPWNMGFLRQGWHREPGGSSTDLKYQTYRGKEV